MYLNNSEIEKYLDTTLRNVVIQEKGEDRLNEILDNNKQLQDFLECGYLKCVYDDYTFYIKGIGKGNGKGMEGVRFCKDRIYILNPKEYVMAVDALVGCGVTKITKEQYEEVMQITNEYMNRMKNYQI